MKKRDVRDYLHDILESIDEVEAFTKAMSFDEFIKDRKTKNAVTRSIEIIGEATNRIIKRDNKFELANAQKIVGTRNRIAHGYDKISDDLIWSIIINHLPKLKLEVQELLSK